MYRMSIPNNYQRVPVFRMQCRETRKVFCSGFMKAIHCCINGLVGPVRSERGSQAFENENFLYP
ncbi:hypothetical protein BDR04DRAFT_1089539 [Suillus decipiens]|nr:hypothetical protein BDR04DRAFT_1089539 [Suillus decipiens]